MDNNIKAVNIDIESNEMSVGCLKNRSVAEMKVKNHNERGNQMKIGKWMFVFVLLFAAGMAMAAVNVQQYLNPDGTVNQAAIEAAIAAGADPTQLAVDLAKANPALADEFAVAIAAAAPNVDVAALAAAVACVVPPAQAVEVVNALIAAFPGAADEILAAIQSDPNVPETCKVAVQQSSQTQTMMVGSNFNTSNQATNQTTTLQTQNTENQQYQQQKADKGRAPSPSS